MSIFQLQQFAVKQTISGMKVCSDSLLFGAIVPVNHVATILDIGAGTGILSLMLAQRANENSELSLKAITAVELTEEAAEEAQENVSNSPWAEQITIIQQDIQQFSRDHKENYNKDYDLIISNPPFFVDQCKTSSKQPLRQAARHSDNLSFSELCQSIDLLLSDLGCVYILLPLTSISQFCHEAFLMNLKLIERIDIAESIDHPVKVSILHFKRSNNLSDEVLKQSRLNKFKLPNIHNDEVRDLLSPFLLRYLN